MLNYASRDPEQEMSTPGNVHDVSPLSLQYVGDALRC